MTAAELAELEAAGHRRDRERLRRAARHLWVALHLLELVRWAPTPDQAVGTARLGREHVRMARGALGAVGFEQHHRPPSSPAS